MFFAIMKINYIFCYFFIIIGNITTTPTIKNIGINGFFKNPPIPPSVFPNPLPTDPTAPPTPSPIPCVRLSPTCEFNGDNPLSPPKMSPNMPIVLYMYTINNK